MASNCAGIDRVVLRAAACFDGDETRALELGEVARYGRLGDAEAADDLLGVELPFEQQIEHAQARRIGKGARGVEQIDLSLAVCATSFGQWRGRRVSLPATVDEVRSRKVDDQVGLVGDVADEAAEMGGRAEGDPGDRGRRAFQNVRDALTGEGRVGLGETPVAERRTPRAASRSIGSSTARACS